MRSGDRTLGDDPSKLEKDQCESGRRLRIIQTRYGENLRDTVTPSEEEAPAKLFDESDEFHAPIPDSQVPQVDLLTVVGALRETLESANRIVDLLLRATTLHDHAGISALWPEVAECEEHTSDLLHGLARLTRNLR